MYQVTSYFLAESSFVTNLKRTYCQHVESPIHPRWNMLTVDGIDNLLHCSSYCATVDGIDSLLAPTVQLAILM